MGFHKKLLEEAGFSTKSALLLFKSYEHSKSNKRAQKGKRTLVTKRKVRKTSNAIHKRKATKRRARKSTSNCKK